MKSVFIFKILLLFYLLPLTAQKTDVSFYHYHSKSYCGAAVPDDERLARLAPKPIRSDLLLYNLENGTASYHYLNADKQKNIDISPGIYLLHNRTLMQYERDELLKLNEKYSCEDIFMFYTSRSDQEKCIEMSHYLNGTALNGWALSSVSNEMLNPFTIIKIENTEAPQHFIHNTHEFCSWQLNGGPPPPKAAQ